MCLMGFGEGGAFTVGHELNVHERFAPEFDGGNAQGCGEFGAYAVGWLGEVVFIFGDGLFGDDSSHGSGEFFQRQAFRKAQVFDSIYHLVDKIHDKYSVCQPPI